MVDFVKSIINESDLRDRLVGSIMLIMYSVAFCIFYYNEVIPAFTQQR